MFASEYKELLVAERSDCQRNSTGPRAAEKLT